MKLSIIYIGKDSKNHFSEAEALYTKRIKQYRPIEIIGIPPLKTSSKFSPEELKSKEADLFKKHLSTSDRVILLDERGKSYDSMQFSRQLQQHMNSGVKRLCLLIGGAYGFSPDMRQKYVSLRLSDMTMAHHLARVVLLEQLYRAFTILNGEPYHNG